MTNVLTPFDSNRPHFSFSQLWTYDRCSMRYKFRYVDGLPEPPRLYFARGRAGHETLEINDRHKIATRSPDNPTGSDQSTEEILDTFSTIFDREVAELTADDLEPGDDPGREKDHTSEILRLWRGKYAPLEIPQAVELDFTMPIATDTDDTLKPVTGRIDKITITHRSVQPNAKPIPRLAIKDYKFVSRKPSNPIDQVELSDQLTMYDMVMTAAGKPPEDLGLEFFIPQTKTIGARIEAVYRPLRYMTPEARHNRHARLLYKITQVAKAIRNGIFIPTDDPRTCADCPYRRMCQYSLTKDDYDAILIRAKST